MSTHKLGAFLVTSPRKDIKMELHDTIAMMESDDLKERFHAEYFQVRI